MKLIIKVLFLVCLTSVSFAKNAHLNSADDDLIIGVHVQRGLYTESIEVRNQIESKLIDLCSQNGVTVQPGMTNPVVIGLRLTNVESRTVETGLTNQIAQVYDVSLVCSNVKTGEIYNTITSRVSGIGKTKDEALKRCLNSININDVKYTAFIDKSKERIIAYYSSQCSNILAHARVLVTAQKFEEAFNQYLSIPRGASCFQEAQTELSSQYLVYIDFKCSSEIVKAKTAIANNDYKQGLSILSRIYGSSKCNKEITDLINTTAREVDEQLRQQWDYLFQQQENNFQLSQARIQASRDIAVAYYSNRPPVYNYNVIVW
jgi:hypothetical protein